MPQRYGIRLKTGPTDHEPAKWSVFEDHAAAAIAAHLNGSEGETLAAAKHRLNGRRWLVRYYVGATGTASEDTLADELATLLDADLGAPGSHVWMGRTSDWTV